MKDKEIIDELYKRNFEHKMFIDAGMCLVKEYYLDDIHYAILISSYGSVELINYTQNKDNNIIDITLIKEFNDDLIFISKNLKSRKNELENKIKQLKEKRSDYR